MGGFAQLLDAVFGYIESAKFWTIIAAYEQGLVLRLGKFNRVLGTGLHWIIPFIEDVFVENVVPSTFHIGPQSLSTADNKAVIAGGIVTWCIHDLKTFLLDVEDAESVLEDSCYGIIGDMIRKNRWEDIVDPDMRFAPKIERRMIRVMKKYGVTVKHFQFSDLTVSKTIRIIGWASE